MQKLINMKDNNKDKIQKEIVDSLPKNPHGLLLIAPRVGKTKIVIDLIERDRPMYIIWVTKSTKLRDVDIPLELKKWSKRSFENSLKVICYSSLNKYTGEADLIILDEYQYLTPLSARNLLNRTLKYRNILGISGTHPVNYEKNLLLNKLKLKVLLDLSLKEAIDKKIVKDFNLFILKSPLSTKRNRRRKKRDGGEFFTSEAKDYLWKSSERLLNTERGPLLRRAFIINSESKLLTTQNLLKELKGRTLVFSGNKKIANQLSPNIYHSTSGNTSLEAFQRKEVDILSCVNSGGVGFTYEDVNNIVICQINKDNTGEMVQKACRGLLSNSDQEVKTNIYFVICKNTVEEEWLTEVLTKFKKEPIIYEPKKL